MADIRVTGVLDDMNRADENPLSHGGDWSGSFSPSTSLLKLTSLAATLGGAGGTNSAAMYWNPMSFDGELIECWGCLVGGNAPGIAWGLDMFQTAQIGTGGVDGYRLRQEVTTGGGSLRMYRVDNGTRTLLQADGAGHTSGVSHPILLLRRYDSTNTFEAWYGLSPYTTWTLLISTTSATYQPPFYIGISLSSNSGGTFHGWGCFGGGLPEEERHRTQIYRWLKAPLTT